MDLSEEELHQISVWAEANCDINFIAMAYWSLMDAVAGIDGAKQAMDMELEKLNVNRGEGQPEEATEDFDVASDSLELLEWYWFEAREKLGRRCLSEMRAAGSTKP